MTGQSESFYVTWQRNRWTIRRSGRLHAVRLLTDRTTAWRLAQRMARKAGGTAWRFGKDGRIDRRRAFHTE